jgi:hypothetical protein
MPSHSSKLQELGQVQIDQQVSIYDIMIGRIKK